MNFILWTVTSILVFISFFKNRAKTLKALKIALKKLIAIMWLFLLVLAGFAIVVVYLPAEIIQEYIGTESGVKGIIIALSVGSISVMPGFAAFPLCAALNSQGIPYYIIAAFSVALMNVGFVTFPLEKKFLGGSVALVRNILALIISIVAIVFFKLIFNNV